MNQYNILTNGTIEIPGYRGTLRGTTLKEVDDANCRLRNGLNVECLAKIFQYLQTKDLFNLGLMSSYYQHIIYEYVINKFHLKLCGSSINPYDNNIEAVLKMYGRKVKWLEIYDLCNVDLLNRCILAYCSTDYLKCLTLHFEGQGIFREVFPSTVQLALLFPYFRQIKMLDVRFPEGNLYYCLLVVKRLEALRILKLDRSSIEILKYAGISMLTELHLGRLLNYFSDCSNLFLFLSELRPQLKHFSNTRTFEITELRIVGQILAKNCSDSIEIFQDVPGRIGKYTRKTYSLRRAMTRYYFLPRFNNLKELTIATMFNYRDLYGTLLDMTKIDKLEKLDIRMQSVTTESEISKWKKWVFNEPKDLRTFTNLKMVSFEFPEYYEEMDFFIKYISKLMPAVETIYIRKCLNSQCLDILKLFPKLRKLYVNRVLVHAEMIINLNSTVAQCKHHDKIQIYPDCTFEFGYL